MACLDTTVLVDLMRSQPRQRERAEAKIYELAQRPEILATTRFNVAELYLGVQQARDPAAESAKVQTLLAELEILDFDDAAARAFAQTAAYLRRLGKMAGDFDLLIAATCMTAGHCLVTRNPAHFENIPHLAVEAY